MFTKLSVRNRVFTGTVVAVGLLCSATGVANAAPFGSYGAEKIVHSAVEDDTLTQLGDTAEAFIDGLLGDVTLSEDVSALIGDSLDVNDLANVYDEYGLADFVDEGEVEDIPDVDIATGEVTLDVAGIDGVFAMRPASTHLVVHSDSVVVSEVDGENVSVVSHVTDELEAQMIAVIGSEESSSVDFDYELPEGYMLVARENGSFALVNPEGIEEGELDVPWAFDANGVAVPTHYELTDAGTIRQVIDTQNATFPVVADPSWKWWVATSSACAAEIAVSLTPIKVAKLAKSISNLAKKSKVVTKAVKALGGAQAATRAVIKEFVIRLRAKAAGKSWQKFIPNYSLSAKQRNQAKKVIDFIGNNVWDFLGLGSCGALIHEVTRR